MPVQFRAPFRSRMELHCAACSLPRDSSSDPLHQARDADSNSSASRVNLYTCISEQSESTDCWTSYAIILFNAFLYFLRSMRLLFNISLVRVLALLGILCPAVPLVAQTALPSLPVVPAFPLEPVSAIATQGQLNIQHE